MPQACLACLCANVTPKLTGKTCSNLRVILESLGAGRQGRRASQPFLFPRPFHAMPPPNAFCLPQDDSFNIYCYFWLFPRSSYNKREPENLARSQSEPSGGAGGSCCAVQEAPSLLGPGPTQRPGCSISSPGDSPPRWSWPSSPALLGRGSLQCATLLPLSETLCHSRKVRTRKSGQFYFRCNIWAVLRCVGEIRAQSRPCTSPRDSGRRTFPAVSSTCLCSCP